MSNGAILVIGDADKSRRRLSDYLIAQGYDVRLAESGEGGVASASTDPPDLILLETHMTSADGFDVCRQLKTHRETRDVPVIFLSMSSAIGERIEGLRLGAVDFLSKPYRLEELLARVKIHVEISRMRTRLEKTIADRTLDLQVADEALDNALTQAVAAHDWALVLRLFEPTAFITIMRYDRVRRWVLRLPQAALIAEPGLAFWRAYVLLSLGRIVDVEHVARTADEHAVGNPARSRIRSARAKAAEMRGDGEISVKLATEGVEMSKQSGLQDSRIQHLWLGTAYCMAGHPRRAEELFRYACSIWDNVDGSNKWMSPICYYWYGRSLYLQGRLNDASAACRQAFLLERQYSGPTITFIYTLEAELLAQRNLLDTAQHSVEKALDLDGSLEQWFSIPLSWQAAACVYYARREFDAGDHIVNSLVEWARRNDSPRVLEKSESLRVNYWLRAGQIERAWLWASDRQLQDDADIAYTSEPTYLTLARIYLFRALDTDDRSLTERAIRLLRRLRKAAKASGRMGDYLATMVLETLAFEQMGHFEAALSLLQKCLTLAIPESAFRAFLDEGEPMQRLLAKAADRGILPETTSGLSAMFTVTIPKNGHVPSGVHTLPGSTILASQAPADSYQRDKLINPLTDREAELLGLIASGLTNTQLADRLFISGNTVKTHLKHLFQKLGASSRTEAVSHARRFGLLS